MTGNQEDALLEIEKLAAGGRGVARHEGRVWFVSGGIPGDRLWARPERVRAKFVEARAVRLETASPDRREAPCPVQESCGGCAWMPLGEAAQRGWKRQLVREALQRIAHIAEPEVEEVRSPSTALGYRNRVEFSAAAALDGSPAIGLWGHVDGRRALIDLAACPLQTHTANGLLRRIRAFVAARPEVGREIVEKGPFRILIRTTPGGKQLVGLWGTKHPFPAAAELASDLVAAGEIHSVVQLIARPGGRGGVRSRTLHGASSLTDRIGELEFDLPAASFVQVNSAGGDELIRLVTELAGNVRGRAVLDLFGGCGAFGLHLALRGARSVVVCDADREAVEAGRRTARKARLSNVRFSHSTVQAYLRSAQETRPGLIVANPPRSGFGRGVAGKIRAMGAGWVLIVSCDPPTLARDLRPFLEGGYRIDRVVPVDLFPQTPHIETVVRLKATGPRPPRQADSPPPASGSD